MKNENKDDQQELRVALLLSKQAETILIELEPISERIMTARFELRYQRVIIGVCYSLTNTAKGADKDHFYAQN